MGYETKRRERDLRLLAGTRGISAGLPLDAQQLWDARERAIICREVSALCSPEEQGPIANPPSPTTYQPPPTTYTLLESLRRRRLADEDSAILLRGLGFHVEPKK
jgi:hypothetical protein